MPFSRSTGTTMRCVAPIGHSPIGDRRLVLELLEDADPMGVVADQRGRDRDAGGRPSPRRVYGSAGGSRSGASLIGTSVALGTGVATSLSTNPPNDEPTAPATRPSPPAPTYSTPTPSATTATASTKRMTIGMPPPRSIG